MAPRLVAIRELLRPEGVAAIHIDEHEHASLVLLCQQIFGEESYLGSMVWDKGNPKGDARHLAHQHELIVLVARDVRRCSPMRRPKENGQRLLDAARRTLAEAPDLDTARGIFDRWVRAAEGLSGGERMYRRLSDDGRVYRLVSMAWPNKRRAPAPYFEPLIHPVTGVACPVPARGWRNPPATMTALLSDGLIEFGQDHSTQPQRRYFLDEHLLEPIPSVLRFAGADDRRLKALGIPFEHPKPLELATRLIQWLCPSDGAVLDVFAGSGTTGHATWLANERDGGRRSFTLVQIDEPVRGRAADEMGFERVDQITESRLRAAASTGDPWPEGTRLDGTAPRRFEREVLVREADDDATR